MPMTATKTPILLTQLARMRASHSSLVRCTGPAGGWNDRTNSDEHGEAGAQAKCDTPSGAELRVGVVEQQGNADDGDENADFVDPIAADEGLPFFAGAVHRLRRGLERPHEHIGQRRNRSGRRGGRLRRLHDGRRAAEVRRRGLTMLHNRRRWRPRPDGGNGVSLFENRDTTFQSVDAVAQISPTNAVIHGSAPYFRLTIPF